MANLLQFMTVFFPQNPTVQPEVVINQPKVGKSRAKMIDSFQTFQGEAIVDQTICPGKPG